LPGTLIISIFFSQAVFMICCIIEAKYKIWSQSNVANLENSKVGDFWFYA